MEDVNNMLNSGEVPNIFGSDEKAELCEKMRVVRNWACNIVKNCANRPMGLKIRQHNWRLIR